MPAGDGPVIVDTTPVIALALVGHLGLLRSLYDRVVVPPAVRAELRAGRSHHAGSVELKAAPWIETVALADPSRADLLSDLDRGEAEVIALGQETRSKLVIVDERLGRLHARRLGLPLTGTMGILLRAKENDLLPAVRPILQRLREGGIYLGAGLVEQALRLAGE